MFEGVSLEYWCVTSQFKHCKKGKMCLPFRKCYLIMVDFPFLEVHYPHYNITYQSGF